MKCASSRRLSRLTDARVGEGRGDSHPPSKTDVAEKWLTKSRAASGRRGSVGRNPIGEVGVEPVAEASDWGDDGRPLRQIGQALMLVGLPLRTGTRNRGIGGRAVGNFDRPIMAMSNFPVIRYRGSYCDTSPPVSLCEAPACSSRRAID